MTQDSSLSSASPQTPRGHAAGSYSCPRTSTGRSFLSKVKKLDHRGAHPPEGATVSPLQALRAGVPREWVTLEVTQEQMGAGLQPPGTS
jgi:hypothetical protein